MGEGKVFRRGRGRRTSAGAGATKTAREGRLVEKVVALVMGRARPAVVELRGEEFQDALRGLRRRRKQRGGLQLGCKGKNDFGRHGLAPCCSTSSRFNCSRNGRLRSKPLNERYRDVTSTTSRHVNFLQRNYKRLFSFFMFQKKARLEPGALEITVREICRNNVSCPATERCGRSACRCDMWNARAVAANHCQA